MGSAVEETKSVAGQLPTTDWMLRCESGPLSGKLFPLPERAIIGRALNCDISIPEGGLSREHAELLVESNQLIVRDLDSSNGTFHNGERVPEARPSHGDLIAFDNMRFRVIGPSNDMDRTIISHAPIRIAKAPEAGAGAAPAAAAAARAATPPPAAAAAAAKAPAAKPAPILSTPDRPVLKAPPPSGGVPAWIVLVALVVILVVLIAVAM